ncbi:MAG: NlpC/P60 family protein [Patescibacteria group bacterium]|nr:NlpC/P60 family protein [Patescibacteria group bacterium]
MKKRILISMVIAFLLLCSTASAFRDVDDAVDWAEDQEGSTNWIMECFVFVRTAYNEWSVPGIGSAIDGWNNNSGVFGDRETDDPNDVPEGALVFFNVSSGNGWYGHVGLCIGDGKMIHAWISKVQEDDIEVGVPTLVGVGLMLGLMMNQFSASPISTSPILKDVSLARAIGEKSW